MGFGGNMEQEERKRMLGKRNRESLRCARG